MGDFAEKVTIAHAAGCRSCLAGFSDEGAAMAHMADQRYPPAARFHHGIDFTRAFDRGQKASGRHCLVLLRSRGRNPDGSPRCARLGVMVSVKTAPLAVRRHTLKRWGRELFRTRLQQRLAGWDMAIVMRSDPPDHATFDSEILALIDKALVAQPEPGRRRRPGPRR